MSDNVTNALMVEIMREMQATLARLEKASLRHDRKLDEHGQRFNAVEARINAVDASIRDVKDELESIIKIELGGQLGNFQAQVGHRLDELEARLAAAGEPPA